MTDAMAVEEYEAFSELEFGLAEQIALLSQATETPTEFEPAGRAIDQADVDFSSMGWTACLVEVQGWLRLPDDLPRDDPDQFFGALARGLGFEEVDVAVETVEGRLRLTQAGLDKLNARLQRAAQLQGEFLADLEADGGSRDSATGRWRQAWEDAASEEEGSGPIVAEALVWNISDFSYRAGHGDLDLSPSYQRGDVWPTSDAQKLIESIVRGIPLPSVIILKPQAAGSPHEVVDGKQRLTTILRFIGKHPQAIERVKAAEEAFGEEFLHLFETDYPKFRKKWKNVVGEQLTSSTEREYYFPFKLRTNSPPLQGDLIFLQGKYYTQIKHVRLPIANDVIEAKELFELSSVYKIPLIKYSKATRRQIHEVFNLYNKQGKHLNAEEIRNALYHEVKLMRALLVSAGDNDDVEQVAPFLTSAWNDLEAISGALDDYGFGRARYRRTKVLSWIASLLLVDSMERGEAKTLPTAIHIDSLFKRIEEDPADPLRSEATICEALRLLLQGMESHLAIPAWAPSFRNNKSGSNWQELPARRQRVGRNHRHSSAGRGGGGEARPSRPRPARQDRVQAVGNPREAVHRIAVEVHRQNLLVGA
ncbi:DUF262 domain-containing protein [Aquihabitans daechungensis]|uniref:DUF262 domain-containing protein n=1 Tax=Aquihabitans daechungensis TaxID=1052257 RepID=UPI003B9F33C2